MRVVLSTDDLGADPIGILTIADFLRGLRLGRVGFISTLRFFFLHCPILHEFERSVVVSLWWNVHRAEWFLYCS